MNEFKFIHKWMGYGNIASPLFVIGPEPGGKPNELRARADAFVELTRLMPEGTQTRLVDGKNFHDKIGERRWFDQNPQIQSTWRRPIITYLMTRNIAITPMTIRNCQRDIFGNSSVAGITKMYLMPLSSPRMNEWHYSKLYPTKAEYMESVIPDRIKWFKGLFNHVRYKRVLLLGFSTQDYWEEIVDTDWTMSSADGKKIRTACDKNGNTFIMCYHPQATQGNDKYFMEIGKTFKAL